MKSTTSSSSKKIQVIAKNYFSDRTEVNFNKLYSSCLPIVRAASNQILRDSIMVDEIIQTVFIKIFTNPNYTFDDDKSFLSYIFTLTTNTSKMAYNKVAKSKTIAVSKLNVSEDMEDNNDLLDILNDERDDSMESIECCELLHNSFNQQYDRILSIVDGIEPERLRFFKDAVFSTEDYTMVKEKYNLNTEGAVKTRVHRTRDKIRQRYQEEINSSKFEDGNINTTGIIRLYHKSTGNIKFEFNLSENSKLHGSAKKYDEDGNLLNESNYNNGVLEGRYIDYFVSGDIKLSGNYTDGKKHGIFKRYDGTNDSHMLTETVDYYMNVKGYYEIFDEFGMLESHGIFE